MIPLPSRVGFSTSRTYNPISAIIRAVTKSPASHCYFVYYDSTLECELVMEAHWTFQLVPYDRWLKENKPVAEYRTEHQSFTRALRSTKEYLGTAYDVTGLLGMAWVLAIAHWFKKKVRNPLQNPKALFCSEAVTKALREEKSPIVKHLPAASSVSPAMLFAAFKKAEATSPKEIQLYTPPVPVPPMKPHR